MDAVYMVRPGPVEELRYSLRSLAANVRHDRVWIFGATPRWVNTDKVEFVERPKVGTKYATTTAHLRAMCEHPDVSDPFALWMDDVFAVRPVGDLPRLHLGPLGDRLTRYVNLRSTWADGMRATAALLAERYPDRRLLSYECHAPLIVHKQAMLEALDVAASMRVPAPHKRTLYGNIAELGGIQLLADPKWVHGGVEPPRGAWLSSDDASFRTLAKPVLTWLFPDPCPYETGGPTFTRRAGDPPRREWTGQANVPPQTQRGAPRASAASKWTNPPPGSGSGVQARFEERRAVLARRKAAAMERAESRRKNG